MRAIGARFGRFTGYDDRSGAQRFGHVESVIRFFDDPDDRGPMALDLPDGTAHWAIGLELSELLRFTAKFSDRTVLLADRCVVPPTNVRRAGSEYFEIDELATRFGSLGCSLVLRDYRDLARSRTGNPIDANLVVLGDFLRHTGGLLGPSDLKEIATSRELGVIEFGFGLATGREGVP